MLRLVTLCHGKQAAEHWEMQQLLSSYVYIYICKDSLYSVVDPLAIKG